MFEDVLETLAGVDRDVSDAQRIDQLTALERVKAACAAVQARITVDFAESQESVAAAWRERARECADDNDFEGWRAAREQARRASVDLGMSAAEKAWDGRSDQRSDLRSDQRSDQRLDRRLVRSSSRRPGLGIGVAGQLALARRESPSRGARHLASALALVRHHPHTLAALEAGSVSEWRAELVVRETAVLTVDQQAAVDAELFDALGMDGVGQLGDRELVRRVRAIAYRIDAQSVVARCRGAEGQRRVTLRPAPDTMCYLTAYLPVAQGVAVLASLVKAAASARSSADERSTGQVMADTLVERVTGQASADVVPVEVQVVVSDRALFAGAFGRGDETPAQVPGYGTVPAGWVRDLVSDPRKPASVRRLYIHPADGTLVAMDSSRRLFDGALRRFVVARDGTCRTPWCDAPIRHIDHVVDHARGGPTSADNAQGECVRCNHTKQLPGWRARPEPALPPGRWRPHTVVTITPTGHRYASTAPPVLPGAPVAEESVLERHWETLLTA